MFDISRISTIDIRTLSEDETDNWCRKLYKYPINDIEKNLDKNDLIQLFQFTRSLLNVKHIQTDVLLEELQNIEQKYEDLENEFDSLKKHHKNNNDNDEDQDDDIKLELKQLKEKCNDQENQLQTLAEQRQELIDELDKKEKELIELRISSSKKLNNSDLMDDNVFDSNERNEMKIRLKEKNEQIEQLLDKIYDSDRINLDLGEQLAKIQVDLTKSENECQLLTARRQMLEQQISELEKFNENLLNEKKRRDQEIANLRNELNQLKTNLMKPAASESSDPTTFYRQMTKEIDKLNALIEVKDSEIKELREIIKMSSSKLSNGNVDQLDEHRDQIERLEEELSILNEGLKQKFQENQAKLQQDNDNEKLTDHITIRKKNRKIRNLKKQIKTLELKYNELEQETRNKDEILQRQRQRMSMLIGGDERLRKLFEENVVLTRMLRSRETRIENLINQLNKHNLTINDSMESDDASNNSLASLQKQETELCDQLIAITVERDVLQRHLDAIKAHMESIHNENLQLQMGMKEILDGLRQTDVTTDLVIECPSLEKVCRLLENRSIYNVGLNSDGQNDENLTQMIILKSELDHVRGQNEQLRIELKNLRTDFLSIIDEYTHDILNNWTMIGTERSPNLNATDSISKTDLDEEIVDDDDEDDLLTDTKIDDDDDDDDEFTEKMDESKSTEGTTSRPRSRIQRIYPSTKEKVEISEVSQQTTPPKLITTGTMICPECIDIGLDPIFLTESKSNDNSKIQMENKSTQTTIELIEDQIENEIVSKENQTLEQSESNKIEKPEDNDDNDDDQYVLMNDVQVQTISVPFKSQSIQTEAWKQPSIEPCEQCEKHLNMLNSVRKLVDQEKQQFELQESKHLDMIESLRQNLSLIKKEYKLDIDARNEEIKDLRDKMIKMSNSIQTMQMENEQKQNSFTVIKSTKNSNDDEEIMAKIVKFQPLSPQQSESTANNQSSNDIRQNKVVLETIVECLQKCLKQKDEALDEYRVMLEQMRQTYSAMDRSRSITMVESNESVVSANTHKDQKKLINNNDDNQINILEMEKIYEDLFVKPKVQENDQLMELLRSTLHQLESVRKKSRERIKQLEDELQTKSNLITEFELNLNHATKQLELNKTQIKSLESESKTKEEKIKTLTAKLNDMIRRNQQSMQTATALKKKVENSIFQESADLRSKISELSAENRRLELEKWNIEKRLTQERQAARERLYERDQQIGQLNEQLEKFQSMITKMEKKLSLNKPKPMPKIETKDQYVQTDLICDEDLPAPKSATNRSVRFRQVEVKREQPMPIQSQQPILIKKKIIKPNISIDSLTKMDEQQEKPQKNKKLIKTKKIVHPQMKSIEVMMDRNDESIQTHEDSMIEIDHDDRDQIEIDSDAENVSIVDDSSRQIIINPINQIESFNDANNEIVSIANQTPSIIDCDHELSLMNKIKKIGQKIKKSSSSSTSSSSLAATSSSSASSSTKSFRLNEMDSYYLDDDDDQDHMKNNENHVSTTTHSHTCHDCESKFQEHRIEQQLIDLRLERILDQNIGRLKSSLENENHLFISDGHPRRISNRKKSRLEQIQFDNNAELDCDRIY